MPKNISIASAVAWSVLVILLYWALYLPGHVNSNRKTLVRVLNLTGGDLNEYKIFSGEGLALTLTGPIKTGGSSEVLIKSDNLKLTHAIASFSNGKSSHYSFGEIEGAIPYRIEITVENENDSSIHYFTKVELN